MENKQKKERSLLFAGTSVVLLHQHSQRFQEEHLEFAVVLNTHGTRQRHPVLPEQLAAATTIRVATGQHPRVNRLGGHAHHTRVRHVLRAWHGLRDTVLLAVAVVVAVSVVKCAVLVRAQIDRRRKNCSVGRLVT